MTDTERIKAAKKHLNINYDVDIKDQLADLSPILDLPVCEEMRRYVIGLCMPIESLHTEDDLIKVREQIKTSL